MYVYMSIGLTLHHRLVNYEPVSVSARTDEWYVERRGRHVLRNEQHKHRERQQDRHAQGDFFTALGRHPEAHQAKARQHDARYDDVIGIVERATPNVQDECDVRIWLRTATANQSHCE